MGLQWSRWEHDSIWVIVDRIRKSSHLLSIKTNHLIKDFAILYIQEVVSIHGVRSPLLNIEVHNLLHNSENLLRKVRFQR